MSSEQKTRVSQVIESIRKLSEAQMWPEAASLASTERARNPKEIFLMALDNRFRSLMDYRLSPTESTEENKALFQRDVLVIQQLCTMALRDVERTSSETPRQVPASSVDASENNSISQHTAVAKPAIVEAKNVQQSMPKIRQAILEMIRQQNYCGAFEYLFSLLAVDPLNEILFGLYEAVQASARHNYKASHFLSAIAQLHAQKKHRIALQILEEALFLDALNDRYHELRTMLEQEQTNLAQKTSTKETPTYHSTGAHAAQAH
jgi:hypothetical protein